MYRCRYCFGECLRIPHADYPCPQIRRSMENAIKLRKSWITHFREIQLFLNLMTLFSNESAYCTDEQALYFVVSHSSICDSLRLPHNLAH